MPDHLWSREETGEDHGEDAAKKSRPCNRAEFSAKYEVHEKDQRCELDGNGGREQDGGEQLPVPEQSVMEQDAEQDDDMIDLSVQETALRDVQGHEERYGGQDDTLLR